MSENRYRILVRTCRAGADGRDEPTLAGYFRAEEVRIEKAPKVSSAKIRINTHDPAAAKDDLDIRWAWDWRKLLRLDDYVEIIAEERPAGEEAVDRTPLFAGFITDADMQWAHLDELVITANGLAHRLNVDAESLIFGRTMNCIDGEARHFDGMSCIFNEGGRPNRHNGGTSPFVTGLSDYYDEIFGGVPIFGDPSTAGLGSTITDCDYWTVGQMVCYLFALYNGGMYIHDPFIGGWTFSDPLPVEVNVQGMSLWKALGLIGEKAGYDFYEKLSLDYPGAVTAEAGMTIRNEGDAISLYRPAPSGDGLAAMEPDRTELFAGQVAESNASCYTAPIVLGGPRLIEVTVPLSPDWPWFSFEGKVIYPDENGNTHESLMDTDYCRRYVIGGADFGLYGDHCRLWSANTEYNGRGVDDTVVDLGDLIDGEPGTWPRMHYVPVPGLLSLLSTKGGEQGFYVEYGFAENASYETYPDPASWIPMDDCELLRDRLGVRLTAGNLAGIVNPDDYGQNFFEYKSYVRMRLTAVIAHPAGNVFRADRRKGSGSLFFTSPTPITRREVGASRERIGSTLTTRPASEDLKPAGIVAADLAEVASRVQDVQAARFIEAELPLERPNFSLAIGDRVTTLDGLGYSLATNCGGQQRYPRIVAVRHLLTAETWQTVATLDTFRKAGVE